MKHNVKLLFVLLSVLFLITPMGIVAFTPTGSTTTLTDAAIPAADYDFTNRRNPIKILVFNQYSDNTAGGEWENVISGILSEYGAAFEYDNLTDHTELETRLPEYDVLLIVEQELATFNQMDTVASQWSGGFLHSWVNDGGIVICMDYYSSVELAYFPTVRILNNTNLMRITDPGIRTGDSVTITDSFDPVMFRVGAFTGASGTMGFDAPDANALMTSLVKTVVAHQYVGLGHVVMLGFDLNTVGPNQLILLANAIRLTRLAVFDNSHAQFYDPWSGYFEFAHQLQTAGFAVETMNTWDETHVESCQVLVAGSNYLTVIPFNETEVDFVTDFVANGGGLLVTTDIWWYGNNTDPIIEEFGFGRKLNAIDYINDTDEYQNMPTQPLYGLENLANHSATFDVSSIQMFGSNAFTTVPSVATPLLWTDSDGSAVWHLGDDASGLTLAASLIHGDGRIVFFADNDFIGDGNGDSDGSQDFVDEDNEIFAINVMTWLSSAGLPEKTVLFDNSNTPHVDISQYLEFSRFLSANGFNIMWMNDFYEDLVDLADVLIIPDGLLNYTTPEIAVIVDFVNRGGGLFVFGDNTVFCEQVNPVVNEFGLEYNETGGYFREDDDFIGADSYIVYDGNNIANHPIMNGVERIELNLNSGFVSIGGGTALLSTDTDGTVNWSNGGLANGVPVFAATTFGMGRVIAIADLNIANLGDADGDGYPRIYDSDNDVFLANAFYWFIENRAPIVEVLFPNGGEVLEGTQIVEWTAVDPNRDELIFSMFISHDNGSSWITRVTGLTGFTYSWNTTIHPDDNSYMIRIRAYDEMTSGDDESDAPFTLDNFEETTPPPGGGLDPMLLAIIGAGVLVVVLVLFFLMKKKKK